MSNERDLRGDHDPTQTNRERWASDDLVMSMLEEAIGPGLDWVCAFHSDGWCTVRLEDDDRSVGFRRRTHQQLEAGVAKAACDLRILAKARLHSPGCECLGTGTAFGLGVTPCPWVRGVDTATAPDTTETATLKSSGRRDGKTQPTPPEGWTPKVGDRVRVTEAGYGFHETQGEVATYVAKVKSGHHVRWSGSTYSVRSVSPVTLPTPEVGDDVVVVCFHPADLDLSIAENTLTKLDAVDTRDAHYPFDTLHYSWVHSVRLADTPGMRTKYPSAPWGGEAD